MIDVNRTRISNSKKYWSTFDTDNVQQYFGTEIDENEYNYGCDYADISELERKTSKGFPGTQPGSTPPLGNFDIANNFT